MSNFVKRTITGALFVIVLLGSIVFHPVSFGLLFSLVIILGLYEFYELVKRSGAQPLRYIGILLSVLFFWAMFFIAKNVLPAGYLLLFLPLVFGVFVIELFRNKPNPYTNIGYTLLGIIYVSIPFSLLTFLVYPDVLYIKYNYHILVGYIILIWTNDTGAYLTGMSLGKHPLFKRVSPKKSWEGFIGGTVLTLVIAFVLSRFYQELFLGEWLAIAVIVSVFGVFGDLAESLLKRSVDVKDSGNFLPGHGGILDRFDSIILSAPFVFTFIQLFKH